MNKQHSPRRLKAERLPVNWLLMAAVVLLVAVIGSSLGTANLMAQYTTSTTGTDSARVARYVVNTQATTSGTSLELSASRKTADYKFTVNNQDADGNTNEVATSYAVEVSFPEKPKGVTLSLKNGTTAVNGTASSDGKTYTFQNAGSFAAGTAKTDNLTLTFTMADDADSATLRGIKIMVNAAQID